MVGSGRERRQRGSALALALAMAFLAAACGSRLSDERLIAAASSTVSEAESATETTTESVVSEPSAPADSTGEGASSGVGDAGPGDDGDSAAPAHSGGGTGDSSDAGGGSEVAGAAPSCEEPLTPIKIASVGQQSGIVGQIVGTGPKAVQAWVSMVNAKGGVRCHPVEYLIEDDGGDPSRHQAAVRRLVEQDGVIAFVQMDAAITGRSSVDYITRQGIPVIGGEGAGQWYYESPVYFPQTPQGVVLLEMAFAGVGQAAREQGLTRLGTISCLEVPICSTVYDKTNELASKNGMEPVSRQKVSLGQPDHTSQCQRARNDRAEVLLLSLDPNSVQRLARACKSIGYRPQFAVISSIATRELADDPNLDGLIVPQPALPWMITSNPANAEFVNALARYAPGMEPDGANNLGWISAKLFERAAQNLSEPPTSQSILEGLWSVSGDDLGGMTMPLTFTQGQNAPQRGCFWITQVRDGAFVTPNSGKRTCP